MPKLIAVKEARNPVVLVTVLEPDKLTRTLSDEDPAKVVTVAVTLVSAKAGLSETWALKVIVLTVFGNKSPKTTPVLISALYGFPSKVKSPW